MLYTVLAVMPWTSMQVNVMGGLSITGNTDPTAVGFMPIFDSYEAADAYRSSQGPKVQRADIMPLYADTGI